MAGAGGGRWSGRGPERTDTRSPVGSGAAVADVPRLSWEDVRRFPGGGSLCVVSDAERVTRLLGGTKLVLSTATMSRSTCRGTKKPEGGAAHS